MKAKILALGLASVAATGVSAQSLLPEGGSLPQSQAPAGTGDPVKTLYRVSGLKDSGGADNQGLVTVILCTNFSQEGEYLKVGLYDYSGTVLANSTYYMNSRRTAAFMTRGNTSYTGTQISIPVVNSGFAVISSTTTNLHCSASVINAGVVGQGFALHMVRYNPHPGSVE